MSWLSNVGGLADLASGAANRLNDGLDRLAKEAGALSDNEEEVPPHFLFETHFIPQIMTTCGTLFSPASTDESDAFFPPLKGADLQNFDEIESLQHQIRKQNGEVSTSTLPQPSHAVFFLNRPSPPPTPTLAIHHTSLSDSQNHKGARRLANPAESDPGSRGQPEPG